MANSVIYGAESAFDPGFESFAGLHTSDDRRSKLVGADVVVDAALDFLRAKRGLPTFLYVHTMDPHVPYAPPPPFDRMFEPFPIPGHPAQDPRTDYKEPLDRERMIGQYDGDIAFGDREFGRFLRELRASGQYEDALIVFVADHGEEFLDHGLWLHGRSLFDELIRVPLVVKFPKEAWAGRRVAEQVQGLDIVPTVLEALGVPLAPDLGGVPLQRVIRGETKPRPALAEISHRGVVAHGVRTEKDKYIRRFSPDDDELYFDLERDPGEQDNRAAQQPQRVRLLEAQAEAGMAQNPFRYVLQLAGAGRFTLQLQDARLARERRGDGLRDRGALDARRQRALAPARGPAERRRAARADVHGAADRRPGPAQRHPRRPAAAQGRRRDRRDGLPSRGLPAPASRHRVGDRGRPRAAAVQGAAPRAGRRADLAQPAGGPDDPGARPRHARAPEGARLRGPWIARGAGGRMARLLVFDLDGTLVDSSRDLAAATNAALQRVAPGTVAIPLDAVIGFVGEGARVLVERSLRHSRLDLSPDDVLPVFLDCYAGRLLDTTRLYPGIAEALDALRSLTLAVLTNKPGPFSRTILEGLGVAARFARIWGAGDVTARKPDPSGLLRLVEELDGQPADTVMIGDSATDVATARAAGVKVLGVAWGLDPSGLRAARPERILEHPRELAELAAE